MRSPHHYVNVVRSLARRIVAIDDRTAAASEAAADLRSEVTELTERLSALETQWRTSAADVRFLGRTRALGSGPLRVVFLVHNPNAWASLAGVYGEMRDSADFDPIVLAIPQHFGGIEGAAGEDVFARLAQTGVPALCVRPGDDPAALLRALAPDVVFRQSQWDADIDARLGADWVSLFRVCLVPYEVTNLIENVGDQASRNTAVDSALHRAAWLVLGTASTARAAARDGALAERKFRAVGHPKLEALRAAAPAWPVADTAARPRVVVSSHHSIGNDWSKFGQLDLVREDLLDWAREGDCELVWMPHPFLPTTVKGNQLPLSAEDLASWRAEWEAIPGAGVYLGDDYPGVVAACDVVVTDGISMLLEPQVLGKPVVFLERPDHVPFNEAGEVVVRGVHRVATVAEARAKVAEILEHGDPLADVQREVVEELFGPPGAATRVLDAIREEARREGWSAPDLFSG